jgi:hypothetical protein
VDAGLTALEAAVVQKLLAGDHPFLIALRTQAASAEVRDREMTGVGFYTALRVQPVPVIAGSGEYELEDVLAELEGLDHGAGFILYVRNGVMDLLEGFSYDEPWPSAVGAFSLRYLREPRVLRLPRDDEGRSPVVVPVTGV